MKATKHGFTLVELLVVIAIIAILIAILLPAVNAVRESARKSTCKSNLRQIGIALSAYHDDHNKFPTFLTSRSGNPMQIANEDKGPNWLVQLLPYLEQESLYNSWNRDIPAHQNPGRSTEVAVFKCPSDNNSWGNHCDYAGGGWARGNYGMNVSPCSHNSSSKTTGGRSHLGGIGAPNFAVRLRRIKDGTSHTVAVDELRAGLNENDIRGCWAMPGLANGTAAFFGDANSPNARGGNSDDMENCEATGMAGNGSRRMGCFHSESTAQMAAQGAHPGGVHILMVDSSVRFVDNDIDSKASKNGCGPGPRGVWQAIHTRAGREVVGKY